MSQELFKILGGQKSIALTDPTHSEGSSTHSRSLDKSCPHSLNRDN